MIRLNLLLLAAVLASALFLVRSQYESRRLFTELDHALSEARRLEVDNERLQVERRAQATPSRVDRLARESLQMRVATPGITQYVSYKGLVLPAAQAASVPNAAPSAAKSLKVKGASS